jgi:hypothetical protein
MSRYSFLLASEEAQYFELTPTIRLKKHGGWLVAESIEQEEISKSQSQSTIKAVQLAKKIAAAKDITLDEAFAALQSGDTSDTEILAEYTEEALSIMNAGSSVEQSNARLITTFIRCRGEGLVDGEWIELKDWSVEDTRAMTRGLVTKMIEFIAEEQDEEVKEAQAKKSKKKGTEEAQQNS